MKKIITFCFFIAALTNLSYSQPMKLDFNEITQSADLIFIGSVQQIKCRWNDNKSMIFTDVYFENNEIINHSNIAKQTYSNNIILTFAGGKVDDDYIEVSDKPNLQINHKYLIFMLDNGKIYSNPIIGAYQGQFEVIKDKFSSQEYIINNNNKALVDITENELVFSNKKIISVNNGISLYKDSEENDSFVLTQAPSSSNENSYAKSSDTNQNNDNKAIITKENFVDYILNTSLKLPLINKQLIFSDSTGYFYDNVNGEIVKKKIKSSKPQNNKTVLSTSSNITNNFFKESNKNDIKGGELGYCGYQSINIVMEQVPTSFSEYNIYKNNMDDMDEIMNVYSSTASDGTFGGNNGENEFANAVSNATLSSVYGFNWNSGHSWGLQRGSYTETYDYDVLTIMQGGYHNIYENGRGIHRSDAILFRLCYTNQTTIKSTIDMGVESYYATNGLHKSNTLYSSYSQGSAITLRNVTVENNSYSAVSDVRLRFYLSSDRNITTSDYQLGGSNQYWTWASFTAEAYNTGNYTTSVPTNIPPGSYYIGAIVTINGYNNDDFTFNNITSFTDQITITSSSNINAFDNSKSINIFPNPVSDKLHIQSESDLGSNTYIKIYDVIGNAVFSSDFNWGDNQFDLFFLPKGVYFIKIYNDSFVANKSFVKS